MTECVTIILIVHDRVCDIDINSTTEGVTLILIVHD